jgi:DNA repair protein SbcC/Rad50
VRLHHLEVTAFGPFGGTVAVDFDELGADGLFLLHGQTGAGKTTILDAVAFALYGRVPGARQDGKRLLSDHAAPGTPPKVVLEATIGGRRLRLTRSPEYQRPKLRGTGTTTEKAKASLEWVDGTGENLTRHEDIGEVVGRLLGMSSDQFFQVVLLPQGDFARFLRADSDDRGKLLERLFDTGRFATVEEWFAARRRADDAAVSGKRAAVDRVAAQVSAAAGIEAGADADPVEWSRRLVEDSREAADAAAASLATAKQVAARAEATLRSARETKQLQDRAAQARERLTQIDEGRERRDELAAEHNRAVRAVAVAAADGAAERARRALERELTRVDELTQIVAREPDGAALLQRVSWPDAEGDAATLADAVRGWGADVTRLDELIGRDATRRQARADLDSARAGHAELSDAARVVADRRGGLPAEIERCEARLSGLRDLAATVLHRADLLDAAREKVAAAGELDRVMALQAAASERNEQARGAHLDARESLADLREQRIAGMAAELAAGLGVDDACPVCGSADHPSPAQPADGAVTKADEDTARVAEQSRALDAEVAAAALAEVEQRVRELSARVGGGGRESLAAALSAAEQAHAEACGAVEAEPAVAQSLSRLRAEGEELAARAQELSAELAALDQRIAGDAERLAELDREIELAVGSETDLRARRDRIDALATAANALRDQRASASRAATAAADAAAHAESAAVAAEFESLDDARAAVRAQARVDEIDAVLTAAREDRVRAEAVLNDPAVVAALAAEPVDTTAAEAEHALASASRDEAMRIATAADDRAAKVEHYADALRAEVEALGPALRRFEELAALAEVVAGRGQNARKMSLRSYVLAARLEEVALSASVRLRRMSGGRYEFVHEDGAGPRGKRGGLGLDIRDDYTGVVRSAKTLSGGESFLASLALALGLADVVAAESGGLVLDTMFIDEGFGTLDADTLEAVMGVLDELREGGRVVGIVSHVDEMRQRIPSRLHVLRGRNGSTLDAIAG